MKSVTGNREQLAGIWDWTWVFRYEVRPHQKIDHVVTLFLTVRSIYKFIFFRRIGFYLKQKICLRFGVSNIHSLLDMIDFNVKHLLKIWNVLFNKCYSGCMLKDLLGIIIMFPFCSICVSQEVWIMKKKWFALHSVLITC